MLSPIWIALQEEYEAHLKTLFGHIRFVIDTDLLFPLMPWIDSRGICWVKLLTSCYLEVCWLQQNKANSDVILKRFSSKVKPTKAVFSNSDFKFHKEVSFWKTLFSHFFRWLWLIPIMRPGSFGSFRCFLDVQICSLVSNNIVRRQLISVYVFDHHQRLVSSFVWSGRYPPFSWSVYDMDHARITCRRGHCGCCCRCCSKTIRRLINLCPVKSMTRWSMLCSCSSQNTTQPFE